MGDSKWYVITGAPSSGKTTIISKLSEMGYYTVPEAARVLIDKEMKKGKTLGEIRKNEIKFQRKVLKLKIQIEKKTPKNKIVFFDRGIPDNIAFFQVYGADPKEVLKLCKEKNYRKIFLLEQLPFEKDYARIEDKEKAKKLGKLLEKTYVDLGYEIVSVPVMKVEDRVNFILSNL